MVSSSVELPTYCAMPVSKVPTHLVTEYWQALIDADLLKYRLCDLAEPTFEDVQQMWMLHNRSMYLVYDNERKCITGEFMFTGFTGKAAQVHFSVHPENTPQYSMKICRTITDSVLNEWADSENLSQPFLFALYGLTPVPNRAACAIIQRTGFKKIGVLPMGQLFGGEPVDALITMKTGKDNGQ